jgi:PAS domain S-box-containing protein
MPRLLRGEQVSNLELRLRRVGQTWERVVSYSGGTLETAGGERLVFLSIYDLTEERAAQAALLQSEEKFRAVFERAGVGMGRVNFTDARWIDVNAAFCRMLGYSAEEMRAIPWPEMTHPDDVNLDLTPFRQMAAGKLESYAVEKRFIDKQRRAVWARLNLTLVRDARGRPDYEIAIVEDISRRKEAENALIETREMLSGIIEGSGDLIAAQDRTFNYLAFNRAYQQEFALIFGKELRVGDNMLEALAHLPQERDNARRLWERAFRGEAFMVTSAFGDATRERRWYEFSFSPISDPDGRLLGAAHIVRDITVRKKAEDDLARIKDELAGVNAELERKIRERTERLRETVNELEHFSYTLTHDLRAPLRGMGAFSNLLLEEYSSQLPPEPQSYLRRIAESAERMDHLITDALQYSLLVRGRFELEPVNTEALLEGILNSYLHLQPPHANIQIQSRMPVVLGNKAGLTQCFSNLLGNAVKFVPPGQTPEVRIWSEPVDGATHRSPNETRDQPDNRGRFVRICVQDNGIGIPREYHEKIWGMFQRLGKQHEGTGIGLALVRKAVERMEGRAGVESEQGKGSRFWIELKTAPQPGKE